ncbi:MAG: dephospho-CoA kinase [candidate division KSB1 bacterium]|nr:dephospho-CoA kinase [candidate division KSB1 bacterium]
MAAERQAVARGLQKFGAVVIDADAKGHLVLEMPDVKSKLGQIFGQGIFVKSDIDRKTLSKLAFESKENVQHLNRIVHPKILTLIAEGSANAGPSGFQLYRH